MAHRLAGVLEKFNRSKHQFDELLAEIDAFFNADPEPHFSLGEFDTNAWEWVERFQIREEPPLRFGVMFGDVLHNLRSSLDHLMWQVTLLDGATPDDATQFPIASKSEAQFNGMAASRIPGLSPEHRALVKRVQPYHAGDEAARHPLSVLATLSNTDKHRIVNPTYSFVASDHGADIELMVQQMEETPQPHPARGLFVIAKGQSMKHGTPWLRIPWDRAEEPPRSVQVDTDMTLGVAFGSPGVSMQDFKRIGEGVLAIIQHFQIDFPETVVIDD